MDAADAYLSGHPDDHRRYLDEIHSFTRLVRTAKSKFYAEQLSTADTKTVFKTVNTLLDRNAIALPYTDSMKNLSNKLLNSDC